MKEYIVLARQNGTTKTGAPYATLKVADQGEVLNVAVWELGPQQEPVVGRIVSFYTLKDNQGKKSCSAMDIKNGPMPDPSHPLYNLLPRPIARELWDETLDHLISFCTDERLVAIMREFGQKLYKPYSEFPAATSVHHAFPGGLLNHTHQMLRMLEGIYPTLPYAVKVERCILAILFHDYGKVYEYNRAGEGLEDKYLLGHVYISAHKLHTELEKQGVDAEETKRIIHCVLAHHGRLEFGSPVIPCTPEAELVNHLDDISAKTDNMDGTGNMEKSFALGTHVVK
ncbi:MAG: HD domain-containing protein [Bacteroidaceae bacterium]|nr:HD domain-containing protein [Bacteroidaceae bacterium]